MAKALQTSSTESRANGPSKSHVIWLHFADPFDLFAPLA